MTLAEYQNAQVQKARLRAALAERRIDLPSARQTALSYNDSVRRLCDSEIKATRPLTLNEWRRVKPTPLRRLWLRLARAVEAIGARVAALVK